jgi:hypothetical protein
MHDYLATLSIETWCSLGYPGKADRTVLAIDVSPDGIARIVVDALDHSRIYGRHVAVQCGASVRL